MKFQNVAYFALICGCLIVIGCAESEQASNRAHHDSETSKDMATINMNPPAIGLAGAAPGESRPDDGIGPGSGGDKYDLIVENSFEEVVNAPLSTFSIDVDTASYSKMRMFLNRGVMPPRDSIRIEELVNYFDYRYPRPKDDHPFATNIEVARCPWQPEHLLARVGIQGKEMERDHRPSSNLVFLLDVSGSMDRQNKLPLVKRGIKMLVDQLNENDRVAIVVYAGAAGTILPSTSCDRKADIIRVLDRLKAGGSTNGGQGLSLAYRLAQENFIQGGVNRILLCTDGDFNVGTTNTSELVQMAEKNARDGIYLSVLGFGMGNHNDAMLEQLSNQADGNYAFIDTTNEARRVLVEQLSGTLVAIAKDVKIQIEFNPAIVKAYRLIGYENRKLADWEFNDDTKDAGEIGAGHSVTALYEIALQSSDTSVTGGSVDDLKYQSSRSVFISEHSHELMTLKLRYKLPESKASNLIEFAVTEYDKPFEVASEDFRFASAVASLGMLLRDSPYKGKANYGDVIEIAETSMNDDRSGYRQEFIELCRKARALAGS